MDSPGSQTRQLGGGYRSRLAVAFLLCAGIAGIAACGGSSSSTGVKGASEVSAQPVSTAGKNPFMPTVGKDRPGIRPPATSSSSSGPATYTASTPGLYGGTRNISTCDVKQMVNYLQQNPSKAAAWASTLGIRTSQIRDYASKLTGVLLRTDTRVTNHGYVSGQANGFQAVLEAGTGVFVDPYGRPVVKCYCGNPLTPPTLLSAPTYSGPTWDGFTTTNITIIQQSTTIITKFVLYDPDTGMTFTRTPGEGGTDGPFQQGPGTGTTGAPTPSSPSGGGNPAGGGQANENPSISLSPNPVTAGGTVSLDGSGFRPNATIDIAVSRPDGGSNSFEASSDGGGNVHFTFPGGGTLTGSFTVTATDHGSGKSASGSITVVPAGGSGGQQTPGNTPTQ